jgi:hypothetical protein
MILTEDAVDRITAEYDAGTLVITPELSRGMKIYRRELFRRLIESGENLTLRDLVYLFSREAICVEIDLDEFETALKRITLMILATLGFSAITCITVAIKYW